MLDLIDIKLFLDEKVKKYNHPVFIQSDPIYIPRQFTTKENIEISAFFTATFAWGQRKAIIKSANNLMERMDYQPFDFILHASEKDLKSITGFKHRTFNEVDCRFFIHSLKNIYQKHHGLENVFNKGYSLSGTVKSSLAYFYSVFFNNSDNPRSIKHVSNVMAGSAAKRLNMFLRWMVRNDLNHVDFGLWKKIPVNALMLPLDIHTGNVSRKLGLLKRKQNDWKSVEEVTSILRTFDESDPIKYDFALFGLGVFEKF